LLRAIIFDFDGILVDSEPLIVKLTQQMAALQGFTLTEEEYYRDYLALDDRGVVELLFQRHGRRVDRARRDELIAWKERAYWEAIQNGLPSFPDAVEFVHQMVKRGLALAIASGSLRAEIEHLLEKIGLRELFPVLVTADDTSKSKPDPEVYLKAVEGLRLAAFNPCVGHAPLCAAECLAIEDAAAGVDAAHAAGMKCMALAHSLPLEGLQHAEWVYNNFGEVDLEPIIAEFAEH